MTPEPTTKTAARGKANRRIRLWHCLLLLALAATGVFWYFNHRISCRLTDGSVVYCDGVVKGRKISDSDFEPDLYEYPYERLFYTKTQRFSLFLDRLWKRPQSDDPHYDPFVFALHAPEIVVIGGGPEVVGYDNPLRAVLHDCFSNEEVFTRESRTFHMNDYQLPMGSAQWRIDLRNDKNQLIGDLIVPNRSFKSTPAFTGNNPPLECTSAKGVLKLQSARFSVSAKINGGERHEVDLEFDASGCPYLLPCQVIGIRVTDSWGNTGFIHGELDPDGKTIHAHWSMVRFNHGSMQSPDWNVRIALCRGWGASLDPKDVVCFDHLAGLLKSHPSSFRSIKGRQLHLRGGFISDRVPPNDWSITRFTWGIDNQSPLVWPVVTKVVGRLPDGEEWDIKPGHCPVENGNSYGYDGPEMVTAGYWIERMRLCSDGISDGQHLAKTPLFNAGLKLPPCQKDFDLYVALEEAQVFEFRTKVSDWPEVKAGER